MLVAPSLPPFEPHPLVRGGHAQTLAAFLWRGEPFVERACRHLVDVPEGDRVVLHDDRPPTWSTGGRVALLIHGLAGCHASPYLQRLVGKLHARGVRVFRMDLRGCGAAVGHTRRPYHAGRSEDAVAALNKIAELCPGSPVGLAGFSLGGNIALKLLGEAPSAVPPNLERVMAVCPPIDLAGCALSLGRGFNRLYDRYFARLVVRQVAAALRVTPDVPLPAGWPKPCRATAPDGGPCDMLSEVTPSTALPGAGRSRTNDSAASAFRLPRGIAEFDATFTAPMSGFASAEEYYRRCSAAQFLPEIRIPTLILAAADDPLVPAATFERLRPSGAVTLCVTRHGGHLGFLSRANGDPDRRWMDWRVVEWCTERS
ncbi:MAG: YheT family hydrolase [Planctomycetaceae bacterium]